MSCEWCTDPDGEPCFPLYGIAPHTHDATGKTVMTPEVEIAGFTPEPAEPGMGTHWCSNCGDGRPT